jgi:hypothetical protein
MGYSDNTVGLALAVASSAFVGGSFILKKLGLMRAGKLGVSAGTHALLPLVDDSRDSSSGSFP